MITNTIYYPLNITKDIIKKTSDGLPPVETLIQKEEYYPVSSGQKSIFVVEQMGYPSNIHNCPIVLSIEGEMDTGRLSTALHNIIARHETLRTSFDIVDGIPLQKVNKSVKLKKTYRKCDKDNIDDTIGEFIRPFNIYTAPLIRVELLKISLLTHLLLLDFHNIIFDGFSMNIFIKELLLLYNGEILPPLKYQYIDFAIWQNNLYQSEQIKSQEKYWFEIFSREIPEFKLPFALSNNNGDDFRGERIGFTLDSDLTLQLKNLSMEIKTEIPLILLTCFNILLARYTSLEDIIIGLPVVGRSKEEFMGIIGTFVNTLPLRNYPTGNKTFKNFLQEVFNNLVEAHNNQDYHIENLIEKLNINRKTGHNPLFDVLFLMEKEEQWEFEMNGLKVNLILNEPEKVKFYFTMGVQIKEEEISFYIEYRKNMFKEQHIKTMGQHFINILKYVTLHPDSNLKSIELMGEDEKRLLLKDFNRTDADYEKNKTIIELFEEQVDKMPDHIALVYKEKKLTYKELNEKANQLGRLLRENGVKPDQIVGIMVEPSIEMIIGTMGILKSGAAYMPIDSKYPIDRINYMFQDSNSSILLTQKQFKDKVDNFIGEILNLDEPGLYKGSVSNLNILTKPHNLAYVIYTSGSTGKPKGTLIEQSSLINLCYFQIDSLNLSNKDKASKYAGFGFDVSVGEIFPTLISGATLYIISDDIRMDPEGLNNYFETNEITVAFLPTQFCEQFMEDIDNKSLRVMDVAGEKLKYFKKRNYKLLNKYGPTEYTVYTTCFLVDKDYANIPIGKPVSNTKIHIVDKYNRLQPIEIPGELCVSGDGLAGGYLNRPELTAEKFIDNPFEPGKKMYRTGDLARWLPDGNIEFLGRMDSQVKIRGFRIEMEEIEHLINEDDAIKNAVVIDKSDEQNNKYLCAYIVSDETIDIGKVRKRLSRDLPDYMLPQYITQIDCIPLTANGKLDRKALPEPAKELLEPYVASRNDTERKIMAIWEEVLGVKNIGVNDNFFSLGGHSLKAIKVVAKLQMDFEITINDMFKYQTIAQLGENIIKRKDFLKTKLYYMKEKALKGQPSAENDPFVKSALESYRKNISLYDKVNLKEKRYYRNILLTGATGYLGIHLLMDLLQQTENDIYLIIRGENEEECRKKLEKKFEYYFSSSSEKYNGRIRIIKGDLSLDKFGLSDNLYNDLSNKIDCIIHSAADVKHYGHYDDFYKSNVVGTKNLLDFTRKGIKKDFNHISTISVAEGKIEGKNKVIYTEEDCNIGQKTENYYAKTKLEAEELVISARKEGIITNIYRIGNIVYNSQTGLFQQNIDDNGFYNLIKSYINLGIAIKEDPWDFTYVDHVSKAILCLYDRINLSNGNYHIINPDRENPGDILTSKELDLNMENLNLPEFIDYMYKHYDIQIYKTYIENIMLHKGWLSEEESNLILVSEKTNSILKRMGFEWPRVSPKYMKKMISQALSERISFLEDVPLFSGLNREEIMAFAGLGREEYYSEESYILWEGEVNNNFYIIMEGNIEIIRNSRAGWPGTIFVIGPNDFLGEGNIWEQNKPSLITGEVFMGDAQVLSFKGDDFIRLMKSFSTFSINLIQEMSNRLKKFEKLIVELG